MDPGYLILVLLFLFAILFLAFLITAIVVIGSGEDTKRKAIDALQSIAARLAHWIDRSG